MNTPPPEDEPTPKTPAANNVPDYVVYMGKTFTRPQARVLLNLLYDSDRVISVNIGEPYGVVPITRSYARDIFARTPQYDLRRTSAQLEALAAQLKRESDLAEQDALDSRE